MVQYLILITGMPGAGKTTLANMFKKKGFFIMSMGDVIRDIANERGLDPSSTVLGNIAKEVRSQGGDSAVADLCVEKIKRLNEKKVVIDGIRSLAEVNSFKSQFNAKLVALYASINTRFKRLQTRGRSDDSKHIDIFNVRDQRELGFSMGHAIALSDYMIINESRITELEHEFSNLLEWLGFDD